MSIIVGKKRLSLFPALSYNNFNKAHIQDSASIVTAAKD